MKFPKKEFLDHKKEKRVQTYITIFTIITIVPSVYLAYGIVIRSIWEEQAKTFVSQEMVFPRTQVLNSNFTYSSSNKTIQVSLIGDQIDQETIGLIKEKAVSFGLTDTEITINQNNAGITDMNLLRSDILKDLYERNEQIIQDKDQRIALLESEVANYGEVRFLGNDIAQEAKINHPKLRKFTLNRSLVTDLEKEKTDTLLVAYAEFSTKPSASETKKLTEWLKLRTKADTVGLILN